MSGVHSLSPQPQALQNLLASATITNVSDSFWFELRQRTGKEEDCNVAVARIHEVGTIGQCAWYPGCTLKEPSYRPQIKRRTRSRPTMVDFGYLRMEIWIGSFAKQVPTWPVPFYEHNVDSYITT
jgi:hypothetical protein